MNALDIQRRLQKIGNKKHAAVSQRFFKTGPGEYGEGDLFIGIRVPVLRKLVKEYKDLPVSEIKILLRSPIHEERLLAILLLVRKFEKGDGNIKKNIYDFYLKSTEFINNWDLVDSSAYHIVGAYLENKDKQPLYKLSKSDRLWERRIAIMSTFHFIRKNQFDETLDLSKQLINDDEDLIHKALGRIQGAAIVARLVIIELIFCVTVV